MDKEAPLDDLLDKLDRSLDRDQDRACLVLEPFGSAIPRLRPMPVIR